MSVDSRVEAIGLEIQSYLDTRPGAVDSIDGIVEWWLPRIRMEEHRELVQIALDRLVQRGTLSQHQIPGGSVVYQRVPSVGTPRPRESST